MARKATSQETKKTKKKVYLLSSLNLVMSRQILLEPYL